MEQFKIGKATVRIHGNPDRERIEAASLKFLKAAEQQRRKVRCEATKKAHKSAEDPVAKAQIEPC